MHNVVNDHGVVMTPADKRVMEQLDRWLTSLELHLKYADLDEANYRQVQPWPEHERPTRWVLELAQQKTLQLKTLCKSHIANKDESFAESLELMHFLANLVGAQNIKRFIPMAVATQERQIKAVDSESTRQSPTVQSPQVADNATRELPQIKRAPSSRSEEPEATREIPKLKMAAKKPSSAARPATDVPIKRPVTKPPVAATAPAVSSTRVQEVVVADAIRLLKWGKEWHELTELIARMAERPAASEVRRILRVHKAAIEAQLG